MTAWELLVHWRQHIEEIVMKRLFHLLLLFLFLFISAAVCSAETAIAPGEPLTLSSAIEIALKNQPSIAAQVGALKTSQAKIGEAKSAYYPQVNLNENYNRTGAASTSDSTSAYSSSTTSTSTSGYNIYNQYSTSASLSQLIYDFGKTGSQVRIQRYNSDSARSDLDSVMNLTAFNVKQAYFALQQAQENRDVAKEAVGQFDIHLRQAKGFYEVGTKPKFDVTKAEVDLSNAKLALIKAENQIRLAFVTLNNAMGMPNAPVYSLVDKLSYGKFELSFDDALKKAYDQNADLKSMAAKKEAAQETINYYRKNYFPVIAGSAGYSYSGGDFPLSEGWSLGVGLSFPLFSGFQTHYQVQGAQSTRDTVAANEAALKQDILLQVQQAFLNLKEADERIVTAQLVIKQAKENLDLANGRYDAGVGSPVDVTDAVVTMANARLSHTSALYDYKTAAATVEKIIGVR